ncbi:MAG: helicase HerA-like domain-containing protein [Candidatus Aenigmatarchaeota archaeon]
MKNILSKLHTILHVKKQGLILGKGYNVITEKKGLITVPYDVMNRHIYILGATGAGKTSLLRNIVYQLINDGWGVLFIDLKGENNILTDMWQACIRANRRKDFIYFSPIRSEKFMTETAVWNPLIHGDASVVTSRLMDAFGTDNPEAEFYEKVKYDILYAIISCMKETNMVFNFKDMSWVLQSAQNMKKLAHITPMGQAKQILTSIINDWIDNPKVYVTYIKGTKVAVQEMATGLASEICNATEPTLDLADAVEKKLVIYSYLPTMYAKASMRAIGKMMLSELKNVFANIQAYVRGKARFAIVIDEFEELAFKSVKDMFNKARSAGVSMIVGHQTLSDINYEIRSVEFTKSLMDNTACKLIMQVNSRETAEMLAGIIGEYPPLPFLDRYIKARWIVPPDVLMGKNAIYDSGLDVGELIAKVEGDIYRVKVYNPNSDLEIGRDFPRPAPRYEKYCYGKALDIENT